jgi:aldehyde dehydrogenase (NAD+)
MALQVEHDNVGSFLPQSSLFIGGKWRDSVGSARIEHINPSTGKTTGSVSAAATQDIDAAVAAAQQSFPLWRGVPPAQRRDLLLRMASLFEKYQDRLAKLAVVENGTPLAFAAYLASMAPAEWFRYAAGWIDKLSGGVAPSMTGVDFSYWTHEPFGVIAIITAYNAPMAFIGMKVAAALAAGNCVIVKSSELTPWSALAFAELCNEAELPKGVVNVINGDARSGDYLVAHPGIAKISFTGGSATAAKILAAIAPRTAPALMELGGKSASIVFDDADLESAAAAVIGASVALQSGQACIAGTRILVQKKVYAPMIELLKRNAVGVPIGDPMLSSTMMGPIISAFHCNRIQQAVQRVVDAGNVRLVLHGERLSGDLASGFFLQPTIFSDVATDHWLSREEIFGPVVGIAPFEDMDEAIAIANSSRYGLAAYVFTQSLDRGLACAQSLRAGSVAVNQLNFLPPNLPFGGFGASGYGREGGLQGILEMTQSKAVQIKVGRP